MVHTAQFYVKLSNKDMERVKQNLGTTNIGSVAECYGEGFTVWVRRHYGIKLYFIVDFIKLLGHASIDESSYMEVEKKLKDFLFYLFGTHGYFKHIVMIRIDYRFDVQMPLEHRQTLLFLYKKTLEKHRHQKKYHKLNTTVYFNSKSIQGTCYDKEEEVKAKGRIMEFYEQDVLRFEVRLQNRHLKYMKYKKDTEKVLKEYFKEVMYKKYMSQYLGNLLLKGKYMKIFKARTIIKNSHLKEKEKNQLNEFLTVVSNTGMENAKKSLSSYFYTKYLSQLATLNINPILIPKNRKDFPSFMNNPFIHK